MTINKMVDSRSEREEISPITRRPDILPRHVRLRALTGQSIKHGQTGLARDDKTLEVSEDDIEVVVEEHVVQTDIAVDHALAVHEAQSIDDLLAPFEAAGERLVRVVLDVVAERAVGVVFQDESVFGETLGFDDSWVRTEDLKNPILDFDAHQIVRIVEVGGVLQHGFVV